MTPKPSRPGAHGEGIPDDSHAFIAECADECPVNSQGDEWARAHPDAAALIGYVPGMATIVRPVARRLQTLTVEVTMEVKGDLHRHINSALASIPTRGGRKEWVYLGE